MSTNPSPTPNSTSVQVPSQNPPEYQIERDLNTKLVPGPKKLLEELRKAVGPDQYYSVEVNLSRATSM